MKTPSNAIDLDPQPLTYALLKAVGGHHQWRWMEPSSLATEQFCLVFNLFVHKD